MTRIMSSRGASAVQGMLKIDKLSRGAQAVTTKVMVNGAAGAANSFTQGFQDLALDTVNGREGDNREYSLKGHIVSTLSGGVFGGAGEIIRPVAGTIANLPKLAKYASPARKVLDIGLHTGLAGTQAAVESWGESKDGSISADKVAFKTLEGFSKAHKNYNPQGTFTNPRTINQMGVIHPKSLSSYTDTQFGRDTLKNTMVGISKENVTSFALDERSNATSYLAENHEKLWENRGNLWDKRSELWSDYQEHRQSKD